MPIGGKIPFNFGLFVFLYEYRFEDETVIHMCSLYQLVRVEEHHNHTADAGNIMLLGLLFLLSYSLQLPHPPFFIFKIRRKWPLENQKNKSLWKKEANEGSDTVPT